MLSHPALGWLRRDGAGDCARDIARVGDIPRRGRMGDDSAKDGSVPIVSIPIREELAGVF